MTRAALLVEDKDKDGNPIFMVYHVALTQMSLEREFDRTFNVFEGATRILPAPTRISMDGYLTDPNPRPWNGPVPNAEQEEVEPVQLAIMSNEEPEEIVIEEDDFEDHWRED